MARAIRNDSERNYTGTNYAVATLIVLLMLVGGYFLVSQISDVADDPMNMPLAEQYTDDGVNSGAPAAGTY